MNEQVQSGNGKRVALRKQIGIMRAALEREFGLAALSGQVSRQLDSVLHGKQYDGDRDLYKVGGYPESLTFAHYRNLYDRDPIAAQIVDLLPGATWRTPPEISEPDQPDGTQFTEAVEALIDRTSLWNMLVRVDMLSRIGSYGVLLIGTRGGDDRTWQREMPRMSGPDDVLYFSAFDEGQAEIVEWETDPNNPRYGLPLIYSIDLSSGISGFRAKGRQVGSTRIHASRVLHVADGLLADDAFGRPALQRVYNDLHDMQKIATSTAEAYWQRVAGILTAKISAGPNDADISDDEITALDTQLKELYHDLRRTFYGRNIELKRLAESEPNPENAAGLYKDRIAAGSGYPKRILFGSETGERASSEDQKMYLGMVSERQKQYAEPRLVRALFDRLIMKNGLPKPGPEGYDVVWPSLYQLTEQEIAEANRARAEAAKALTPAGGDPLLLIEIDEDRNVWLVPRKPEEASPFAAPEPQPDPTAQSDPGIVDQPEDEPSPEDTPGEPVQQT